MNQTIFIDGYKSLENLKLELKPGLNALIGANGAGKSNILDALNFISNLIRLDLNEISDKLGLVRVSELFNLNQPNNEILIILNGSHRNECRNLKFSQFDVLNKDNKIVSLYTKYNYEFRIGFDKNNQDPLTYLAQKLILEFEIGGAEYTLPNTLAVEYSNDNCIVKEYYLNEVEDYISHEVKALPEYLKSNFGLYKTNSILSSIGVHLYPIRNLTQDISFGEVYDINPSVVRSDAFNIHKPNLQFDGSGLAYTLHKLKQNNEKIYQSVIEGMKLVSPDISDIKVNYNEHQKKYEIVTVIRSDYDSNKYQEIPLELISDGALKWYVLVTIMVVSTKTIVIDEPENFLNPRLHRIFVSYLRERLNFKEIYGIITSHSESLVDFIDPEELIYVRFKDGRTNASRVIEIKSLRSHMDKYDTGLGWYFISDNLDYYCFDEVP